MSHVLPDALAGEPSAELDDCDDRAPEPLVDRDRVTDVVAVTMGQRDQVTPLGRELRLGALRVSVQEWIDVDPLPAGRVDAERRVPQPGQFRRHDRNLENRDHGRTGDPLGIGGRTNPTQAQNGSDDAASEATSRIGCTTKKEPTVTATAAVIATPSAESRGGEPPATARRSSAPERMYIQRTTLR